MEGGKKRMSERGGMMRAMRGICYRKEEREERGGNEE